MFMLQILRLNASQGCYLLHKDGITGISFAGLLLFHNSNIFNCNLEGGAVSKFRVNTMFLQICHYLIALLH